MKISRKLKKKKKKKPKIKFKTNNEKWVLALEVCVVGVY